MAKGFSLDFNGFLDLAEDISNIGDNVLLDATVKALEESAKLTNIEVGAAMKKSKFNFTKGKGYSQGKARESLIKVSQMPTEVNGTEVIAYAGVDLKDAPEALILSMKGTPHEAGDKKLLNALKVKGSFRKKIDKLQSDIFTNVLLVESLERRR